MRKPECEDMGNLYEMIDKVKKAWYDTTDRLSVVSHVIGWAQLLAKMVEIK